MADVELELYDGNKSWLYILRILPINMFFQQEQFRHLQNKGILWMA